MKWLKVLTEVVSQKGIERERDLLFNNEAYSMAVGMYELAISECHPFIYRPQATTDPLSSVDSTDALGNFSEIDLPFSSCSFEILNGSLISAIETLEDNQSLNQLSSEQIRTLKRTFLIRCILIREMFPQQFACFGLFENPADKTFEVKYWRENKTEGELEKDVFFVTTTIFKILNQLNTNGGYTEKIKERVKVGRGKNRIAHTIKTLIHIKSTKSASSSSLLGGRLDFSHRFEVMGHWRAVKGVGKDREGNYCIENWTWVIPHVRGPEELPLIKKTRLFEPSAHTTE